MAERPFTIAIAEGALNHLDELRDQFAGAAELRVGSVSAAADVARLTDGADAILVGLQPLRAEHMAALSPTVRIVARAGVGLDTIDVAAARARQVPVVYQPNYATNEVADQAASLALAVWRRLATADRLVRDNGWGTSVQVGPVHALQDATLGVLGSGRIGRAVIQRLRPFVSRVVVFDAYRDETLEDVEWAESVDSLLGTADLVTLHLPLTEQTRNVIDAAAITGMRDGAVLVNVARGGLIDERALAEALVSGKLGGAGLDVFAEEPLPDGSPLRNAPNLLLSPHVAWYSVESSGRLASWSIDDVISHLSDEDLTHGSWA
jgi:D-3-phosphoglycerate dehydrogenase